MKQIFYGLSLVLLFNSPMSLAEAPVQTDGVQVEKNSLWSKLAPAKMVEQQSLQQYSQLKSEAKNQGKLLPDNHPQVQRLHRIAKRIIPVSLRWNERAPNWQWEVNLIDSPDINAFCMPGGKIAFFTGIIDKLQLTDDEIAIIMGHEVAHALREHSRKQMAQGMAVNIGASLTSQALGLGDTMQMLLGKGAQLTMLKFSRGDEIDADIVGLDIAARAAFDPRAGVTLWQKMEAASKGAPPQWLSTHPSGKNRIAEIQRRLPEVMPLYQKAIARPSNTNTR